MGLQLLGKEASDKIAERGGDNEHKCRQVLFQWLENDANATYSTLMKAVKHTRYGIIF